jgi:hypothetical protein
MAGLPSPSGMGGNHGDMQAYLSEEIREKKNGFHPISLLLLLVSSLFRIPTKNPPGGGFKQQECVIRYTHL